MEHPGADITRDILNCAFEVHNALGPGFLESVYERALSHELNLRGIPHERQVAVPVYYKNELVGTHRLDILVHGLVIVELKSVEEVTDVHKAIVLSYLSATRLSVALLLNFRSRSLSIKRIVK